MRRLLFLICAIVLLDISFYAAITPLLPYYADTLGLSKTAAGVLVASYGAGTLTASLPGGLLGARFGPRPLLIAGLLLLAVTSVVFGLADSLAVLDGARFAQGVGSALSWTGGMGWLSAAAPSERRGQMLGTAMAAATAGALLGPVLGALARGVGPEVAFSSVGVLALVMLVFVLLQPGRERGTIEEGGSLREAFRHPLIARGLWIVSSTALCYGVLNVLLPLRLDDAGASAAVIAAVWLLAAALESVINPLTGRHADRHGWTGLARFGLVAAALVSVAAALPHAVLPLALVGIASGPLIGVLWTPGLVLLGAGSDAAGFEHTYAFALMNLAWAAGQTVATAGGGALADATRDIVPLAVVAAVALGTALTIPRPRARTAAGGA